MKFEKEVRGQWKSKGLEGYEWETIYGKECVITLEPRPHYCDRGNFIAKITAFDDLALSLDWADGWPRYYFDKGRAKAEIEAWLKKRKQL